MAHPQNSPRGLWAKNLRVPTDGGLYLASYSTSSALLSANSTGVVVAGSIKVSNKTNGYISANTTGVVINAGLKVSDKANAVLTGNSTGLVVVGGVKVSNAANAVLTGNSTGIVTNAQIKVANKQYLSANSTGFIFGAVAAAPAARSSAKVAFFTNSTGANAVMVNTTGTTWKYLNVTTVLPA